ncbi:hypothetical protein [Streptomyces mirabilis]|uniref:hypothetical protein n=1 Tax=Streptomyces mirabilis TaxID=68239 RepID=UPI0036A14B85
MSQLTDVAEELVALGAVSLHDLAQPDPNAKRVVRRDANALHRANGGARPYAAVAAGSGSPGRRCARGKDSAYQRPATLGGGQESTAQEPALLRAENARLLEAEKERQLEREILRWDSHLLSWFRRVRPPAVGRDGGEAIRDGHAVFS